MVNKEVYFTDISFSDTAVLVKTHDPLVWRNVVLCKHCLIFWIIIFLVLCTFYILRYLNKLGNLDIELAYFNVRRYLFIYNIFFSKHQKTANTLKIKKWIIVNYFHLWAYIFRSPFFFLFSVIIRDLNIKATSCEEKKETKRIVLLF